MSIYKTRIEQMKELLLWGKGEQYLWTVTVPEQG